MTAQIFKILPSQSFLRIAYASAKTIPGVLTSQGSSTFGRYAALVIQSACTTLAIWFIGSAGTRNPLSSRSHSEVDMPSHASPGRCSFTRLFASVP